MTYFLFYPAIGFDVPEVVGKINKMLFGVSIAVALPVGESPHAGFWGRNRLFSACAKVALQLGKSKKGKHFASEYQKLPPACIPNSVISSLVVRLKKQNQHHVPSISPLHAAILFTAALCAG
jgi:hypothetical protein